MYKKILIIVTIIAIIAGAVFAFLEITQTVKSTASLEKGADFNEEILMGIAKKAATEPYQKPQNNLPPELKTLDYDQHRDIRFNRDNGPWFGKGLSFEVQFFHLGSLFENSIPINEVEDGKTAPISYSHKFFDFGKNTINTNFSKNLGYAGFRLHYPLNSSEYYDELVAFLGASYFRGLAKGQKYGLSARGLAIDTALATGEEFPIFKEYWLEKPKPNSRTIKIYALLDSPSISGAYTFVITPGTNTKMVVKAVLFPRKNIAKIGIAPLTSMFLFGENTKNKFDDYRPEVHDSDGLLINNGNDEWLWRPLDNSKYLRISSFEDNNPKGFGLLQRDRNPEHYIDFEANYEQRPSAYIEPIGDWGKGVVQLVEIPSNLEIHDNIVAFWTPKEPIEAGKSYSFEYNIWWLNHVIKDENLAQVVATRTGIGGVSGVHEEGTRKFVIDFDNISKNQVEDISFVTNASEGAIKNQYMIYNPLIKGVSVYMDYVPNGKTSEIRVALKKGDKTISEVWSYQWLQ